MERYKDTGPAQGGGGAGWGGPPGPKNVGGPLLVMCCVVLGLHDICATYQLGPAASIGALLLFLDAVTHRRRSLRSLRV
jgi:hypothetical protein